MPCPVHSSRPFVLYESLDSICFSNSAQVELLKEQRRIQSLEAFLAEDAISLLTTKEHLKLPNELVGSLFAEEEKSINKWKCFGKTAPEKNPLKRQHNKRNPTDAPASKVPAPSGFNVNAPVFVPRTTSGSSTPTSPNCCGSPSPTPSSGAFSFNLGVVNAPKSGIQTRRQELNGDSFMIVPSDDVVPPRRIKMFTPEEVEKQRQLVEEFKRNVFKDF
ncbi:hypothetical protein CAEBREN_19094 [Caenorhabditis brenneri]|uniref:Uncharacterized protein n=1 Tax=Caenorhabditis brenneri TaxID=135651 RepID=G0NZE4_CAEBE|nr:hypothetical protein CAEBREN_19094 [Caenorhabditis brenneri]